MLRGLRARGRTGFGRAKMARWFGHLWVSHSWPRLRLRTLRMPGSVPPGRDFRAALGLLCKLAPPD
jgi:hypothetical protein